MKSKNSYPIEWIRKIDNEINFSINNGLPGVVFTAFIDNEKVFQKAYGYQRIYNQKKIMPNPETMRLDTIFDMASLTKIFSTTLAYMKLVDDKMLSIDDKIQKYIPKFKGGDKDTITIKQLLQHNSGLPSNFHFYNPDLVPPAFYSQSREKTIELLPLLPLQYKPCTVTLYSDINFILLGLILEKVTGMRQDDFVQKNIYQPLGLKNTGYIPHIKGIDKNRFAATERCGNTRDWLVLFPNVRTKTIQGEVQDEFTYYSMEQVSGSAGLFSTANDLSILCRLILNKGHYGSFHLCSKQTINLFLESLNIDKTYSLGFEIPTVKNQISFGVLLPKAGKAYGHTGWTGNCFVIDIQNNAFAIILTNKTHTPLIRVENLRKFQGDLLPAATYGAIIQLFYGGILSRNGF